MKTVSVEILLSLSEDLHDDAIEKLRDDVKRYLAHMLDASRVGRVGKSDVFIRAEQRPSQPAEERLAIEKIEIARLRQKARDAVDNSHNLAAAHQRVRAQALALTTGIAELRGQLSQLSETYHAVPGRKE